jgi:hypothetical protein
MRRLRFSMKWIKVCDESSACSCLPFPLVDTSWAALVSIRAPWDWKSDGWVSVNTCVRRSCLGTANNPVSKLSPTAE